MMRHSAFSADEIHAATFVRYIEIHDTLGSTNDRAAELARETNVELPALVVARHQTAGRGRGRNTWWSAEGALTFSVLLEPAKMGIVTANWPQLSLATSVAVCDALQIELDATQQRAEASSPPAGLEDEPARRNPQPRLGIKWPNDVMLNGRKVSGILIESPGGAAPAKDRLIVGIGINVNNSWYTKPCISASGGTALCDVTGMDHDIQLLLKRFLQKWHTRLGELAGNDPQLSKAWQQYCNLTGRIVRIEIGERHIDGECLGMAIDGAIVIKSRTGRHLSYSGSVRLLK